MIGGHYEVESGDGKMYLLHPQNLHANQIVCLTVQIFHAFIFVNTWLHAHAMITSMDICVNTATGFTAYKISSQ